MSALDTGEDSVVNDDGVGMIQGLKCNCPDNCDNTIYNQAILLRSSSTELGTCGYFHFQLSEFDLGRLF